jgi:hypothetical protein
MSDVVQSVRQAMQDFIAPELREIKSDVKRLDAKIDSETIRLEDKIDTDMKRIESKMDSGFTHLQTLLENANLRAEPEAARDIANLRERVTRLETERGIQRQ